MHRSWQFEVHGRRLAVMEWGDPQGVPVVALHGWLDNAASFTLLARHLPRVRLIALDLAGHGLSDHRAVGQPYYIWDNVADVLALLDELALEQVVLLGHSLGAGVATLFAGAFPERVGRMVLIDGLVPLDYAADQLPEQMAEALLRGTRLSRRSLRPYASFEQAVQARMNGRWPVSREAAGWLLERGLKQQSDGWVWRSDLALTQASIVRLCEQQIAAFVRRLTMPVLLVMAERSEERALVESMRAQVPELEFKTLVGSHHLHLEAAASLQIAEWIAERLA
ncbi:pimeloyl-ACP methyl ester carboxylesterase [Oceanisphaera litoralis]|uniref:alpha/beta fold hydrolase n=1 Tax=Oceanisphaera litoralis TaxID=225144 RepID=UPI00195B996A|nr:alpha/beta hydrolase [Oceanisphaera litoralis]MBM7455037.1 pimeloyl-ACP methyl ester carboxylesterase [Oceanisphaera litoralis]